MKRLQSFQITDDMRIANEVAIEVEVRFEDGERRWCYFMTPEALASCGDILEGTEVRIHPGVKHMIVASRLDRNVVERALHQLDTEGTLHDHTVEYT